MDVSILDQLHHLQQLFIKKQEVTNEPKSSVKFDKKLLEYDYGEEEDDDVVVTNSPNTAGLTNTQHNAVSTNSGLESLGLLLTNPEVLMKDQLLKRNFNNNIIIILMYYLKVLRQLQTLQQTMQGNVSSSQHEMEEKIRKLQQMKQQEEEFDKHLAQAVSVSSYANVYIIF